MILLVPTQYVMIPSILAIPENTLQYPTSLNTNLTPDTCYFSMYLMYNKSHTILVLNDTICYHQKLEYCRHYRPVPSQYSTDGFVSVWYGDDINYCNHEKKLTGICALLWQKKALLCRLSFLLFLLWIIIVKRGHFNHSIEFANKIRAFLWSRSY